MKTKIAMVISIAGVLVAGSAAALVNAQVLGGATSSTPLVVDNPPQIDQTVPTITVAPTVTSPIVDTTTSIAPAAPAAPPPAVATQATYAVGDSGTVTLDTANDVLTIVGVTPASGWTVSKSESNDPTNVEVKFQAGTVEVEFHANLLFGVVTPSVESHDLSASNSSVDNGGGGRHSGGDDGDDHGGDDD